MVQLGGLVCLPSHLRPHGLLQPILFVITPPSPPKKESESKILKVLKKIIIFSPNHLNSQQMNRTASSPQPAFSSVFPPATTGLGISLLPPHTSKGFPVMIPAIPYHFMSTALPQRGKNILSPLLPSTRRSRYFCRSLQGNRGIRRGCGCWHRVMCSTPGSAQTLAYS